MIIIEIGNANVAKSEIMFHFGFFIAILKPLIYDTSFDLELKRFKKSFLLNFSIELLPEVHISSEIWYVG